MHVCSTSQTPTVQQLLDRIKAVEDSQTGPSVGYNMLTKILHYGFRRPEDFDKYAALRLSEQLAASARLASDPKAPSYEAIASTLRQKIWLASGSVQGIFFSLVS